MGFKNDMQADIEETFFDDDEFSYSAVYQAKSGLTKTISIIFDGGNDLLQTGASIRNDAIVQIKKTDFCPLADDKLIFEGETWRVLKVLSSDLFISSTLITSDDKMAVSF